jgi:hypothetical protein
MLRITRSFSKVPFLCKNLPKDDITKALSLLSGKLSVDDIEKDKYIQYFTQVLNNDIKESRSALVENHINHSIIGLNTLLTVNSTKKDPISSKEDILRCQSSQQLKHIFDSLILRDELNELNLRSFLMNKYMDLEYIYERLQYHKYTNYMILVCYRAVILKQYAFGEDIYTENISKWTEREDLSPFLEKLLYQLIWKITKDLTLIRSMNLSRSSYILLIESIPRQLYQYELDMTLTKNQELLISCIKHMIEQPITKQSNKQLHKLIKLSNDSKVFVEENDEVDLRKYRFRYGLREWIIEVDEQLKQLGDVMKRLEGLEEYNEMVVRFI